MKHLDNIPDDVIAELNIPTGVPLVYELDASLKPVKQTDAIEPLSGRYLGNQEDIRARILGVKVTFYDNRVFQHLPDHDDADDVLRIKPNNSMAVIMIMMRMMVMYAWGTS